MNQPKISIITPTLNQAHYIEATIQSVINQHYPNLEYIVLDGGSNDGTIEILEKYDQFIDYWVSEKDNGQTEAINKGVKRATGDIIAYLNSDDRLTPGTLELVNHWYQYGSTLWFVGGCTFVDANGDAIKNWYPSLPPKSKYALIAGPWGVPQPSCFWKRELFDTIGLFDENYNYVFDTEFQIRSIINGKIPTCTTMILSEATIHDESKTGQSTGVGHFWREEIAMLDAYRDQLNENENALVTTTQWLLDIGNPNSTQRPTPTVLQYVKSLRLKKNFTLRATIGALLRTLGFRKWKFPAGAK